MRKLITAGTTAILTLTLAASPAIAKKPKLDAAQFAYPATIDCGKGPIAVGSTEDMYAPLVNLKTGKSYQPIAWAVWFGDQLIEDSNGMTSKKPAVCSYVDEWVHGTVTLKKR
jgi:hypothetical protein